MGLASVEPIMAVEGRFGIRIDDTEVSWNLTVGELYGLVLTKLGCVAVPDDGCPSSRAFYQVRRALMGSLGVPRTAVRPDSRLEELVPHNGRQAAWDRLTTALDGVLSWLRLPPWFCQLQWGLVAAGVAVGLAAWGQVLPRWAVVLPCVAVVASAAAVDHFRTAIPEGFMSVREAVAHLATHDALLRVASEAGRDDVWQALRQLFVEKLGLDPSEVTPQARVVDLAGD